MSTAPQTPGRLAALQARHHVEEGELLRDAMAASEWRLEHAAAWLGEHVRVSSVQRMLQRHAWVEDERQKRTLASRAETLRALLDASRDGRLDALRKSDPRAAKAVVLRFGLDVPGRNVYRVLEDVGAMMGGVTRERARQLEERALAALGISIT